MKVPDSGMPEEDYWNSLFDIPGIVAWLPVTEQTKLVVEIGCGYGTFTIPLAKAIPGHVHAFDIEQGMIDATASRLDQCRLQNVTLSNRDVIETGTGLANESADLVLLFNILHSEEKWTLIAEAERILRQGGIIAIVHWRKDIKTPRGPAMPSRPDPSQIARAITGLKLKPHGPPTILEPFHWGVQLIKESCKG